MTYALLRGVLMDLHGSPDALRLLYCRAISWPLKPRNSQRSRRVLDLLNEDMDVSRRLKICLVLWQPRHGIDLAPSTAYCLCTCCIRATCPHNTSGKMKQHKSTPKTRRAMTAINQLGKTSSTSAETSPCLYHPIHPDLVANPCATPAATCADTWGIPAEYKNTSSSIQWNNGISSNSWFLIFGHSIK